jgi:hypothetical protein
MRELANMSIEELINEVITSGDQVQDLNLRLGELQGDFDGSEALNIIADRMEAQNRYNSANRLLRIRIRMMEGQKTND